MKTKLTAFLVLASLAIASVGLGQVKAPPQKKDFEDVLEIYKNNVERFDDMEMYKEAKLYNAETKETKKFKDLDEYSQDFFVIEQGRRLTTDMLKLALFWKVDKAQLQHALTQGQEIKTDVKPEDLDKYSADLLEVRKSMAVRFEVLVDKLLEKHSDKFSDQEKKEFMDELKNFHNKYKLVDRSE